MRQDMWSNTVNVKVNGQTIDLGIWDTLSGGDVSFNETKYAPGGMQPQVSIGGTKTVNNITVGKMLDQNSSDWNMCQLLMGLTEEADCTITRQPLGTDGRPFGAPLVYTGKLISIAPGDTDSNAEGAQIWQLTCSTNATVAA